MAKKLAPIEQRSPQVTPAQGIELLKVSLEKGKALLAANGFDDNAYSTWELLTRNYLEKAFGVNSPNVGSITDVGKYGSFPMNPGPEFWINHHRESLAEQLQKIGGLIELLETEMRIVGTPNTEVAKQPGGHKVFLVHGHNEHILHESARFIEKLGVEVVVLREQPNSGMTIIEKFESYADVGFAVILLTDDDVGGLKGRLLEEVRPRARQNVVFEFGYFIGKLGRNRVCALYSKGVEIPSDYSGVLYLQIDEQGAWRLRLAKEMKAAGFIIDMNSAL